jgi:hypothetical protein
VGAATVDELDAAGGEVEGQVRLGRVCGGGGESLRWWGRERRKMRKRTTCN